MAVAWTLARAGFRHRLLGLVGLAVVLAIGMGVSLVAFEVAARTENAFPSHLAQANVGELGLNPGLSDARAALPGGWAHIRQYRTGTPASLCDHGDRVTSTATCAASSPSTVKFQSSASRR